MHAYRVISMSTREGRAVRATRRSPIGGHPIHAEVASGHGARRVCLRAFRVGLDRRLLLSLDAFDGMGYDFRVERWPVGC